jgi:hypothetical protein
MSQFWMLFIEMEESPSLARLDEGRLSFCTTICAPDRNAPYKREWARLNDSMALVLGHAQRDELPGALHGRCADPDARRRVGPDQVQP